MTSLALLLMATCGYLHWEVMRLRREIRTQRKVMNDTMNVMEDKLDKVLKAQAALGDAGVEMQRLLPSLRSALQTFSDFNKTY